MSTHVLSLNYRYELPGRQLLEIIRHTAKTSLQMVGTTLESSAAIITFLTDRSTIKFHLASAKHVSVCASARRSNEALQVCRQLVGRKVLQPLPEKLSAPAKSGKSFRRAKEVLAEYLAKPEFGAHVLVLPEALAQAEDCVFEYDGTLARYLNGLAAFARLKLDAANLAKTDEYLAEKAGLGHFRSGLGERARRDHAEDYAAFYKGARRLFPLHVTLGQGLSPQSCMSIYFDWDPEVRKLILARFGRHGRGA